jgi:hypothetical protein
MTGRSAPPAPLWRRWVGAMSAALIVTVVAACSTAAPERRPQAEELTQHIRAMPGVLAATADLANNVAQAMVYFWLTVEVADDITGDQLAAITAHYLDGLRTVEYTGYQTELDVRNDRDVFAVEGDTRPVTNRDQITEQARRWVALRHEFPGATLTFHATITHPPGQTHPNAGPGRTPGTDLGHSNTGVIELPEAADYTAVAATATALATRFPDLGGGTWTISAGKAHPADIITTQRLPTPDEMRVWNELNADQSIPHVDAMTINAAATAPVWISEKTQTHDIAVALQLARQHLPTAAQLPAPVLYTSTDQIQAHRNYYGQTAGPVAITIGGCTQRTYPPDPAEQTLIATYETCRH